MPGVNSTFAKIVGSPTDTAWSQTYSAGDLYAVISLGKKDEEELSLNVLGKGILNNIEAEFFTLEEKTLATIKDALAKALTSTPESVPVNLTLAFIKDQIAYLFTIGKTRVLLQRGGKMGIILTAEGKASDARTIHAASGMLRDDDVLILQTEGFSAHISDQDILTALEATSLADVEEALMPRIHAKEAGDAGALLIKIRGPVKESDEEPEEAVLPIQEDEATSQEDTQPVSTKPQPVTEEEAEPYVSSSTRFEERRQRQFPRLHLSSLPRLRGKRLLFLILALVLAVTLGGSVYMVSKNREQVKTSAVFQEIYNKALSEYDLGVSLEELNKAVALDNFLKAQKTVQENKGKFKEGTQEREKLDELSAKIDAKLGGGSEGKQVEAKAADDDASPLLALQKAVKTQFVTGAENKYFYVTPEAVFETDAKGSSKKELYENDDDWSDLAGIGAFGTNVYVLDRKESVLKFVAGSGGYGKQGYFKNDPPNLSQAADMAIDGSVWILFKDGSILRYTKGEKETFSISALQKPLSNPTKIVTNEESDNLYILDRGNSRIVVLDKSGTFKNAYATQVAGKAAGMAVNEADKKIYLLSDGKIYELSL